MERQQFQTIYEPSGAQQLPDGRIVMVGDEHVDPLSMFVLDDDGNMTATPIEYRALLATTTKRSKPGKISDLEAITLSDNDYVYAITSHSRRASGKRKSAREKLVRFKLDGNDVVDPGAVSGLRQAITETHSALKKAARASKVKSDNGFNIEGLSFDKAKAKLLIGLRSPVIDGNAVVVVMENPLSVFENDEAPKVSEELILLDLDKGGIRSMTFDPKLDGHLIISRREDKRNKPFKLWFWDGDADHAPRRVRIGLRGGIPRAEGIASVSHNGHERLLLVFDDGDAKKGQGAHYLLLDYDRLTIDP